MGELTVFAKRLREVRERCGLKQNALAAKIGVTAQTISAYEKADIGGKGKNPTLETAVSLARTLNVSLDWLCGIDGGNIKIGEVQTLGDIARAISKAMSIFGINAYENIRFDTQFGTISCPGLLFNDTELKNFLSDSTKMRKLLDEKIFNEDFYKRWEADRLHALDAIAIDEYIDSQLPF